VSCRADLKEHRRTERARHEAALQEARRRVAQHEYETAQVQLLKLVSLKDPRHADLSREASELLQHLAAEQQRGQAAAEAAREKALKHLERGDDEAALGVLTSVPAPLRTEQTQKLLAEVQSRVEAVLALRQQIATAARTQDLASLSAGIERLLELRPKDAQTRRAAVQLRTKLLRGAERELARHDYARAVGLLEHVPQRERDAEYARLRAQADELHWLLTDLRTAPIVDATLVAVAERLMKLSPKHPDAQRLLEEVELRLDQLPQDPRHATPSWVVPAQDALGFPVHWLAGLRRIRCAPRLEARLREEPGRFYVACGLALQGIDRAAVSLNLAASEKDNGFFRLQFGRKRPASQAWGLDFGGSALKAVRLGLDEQQQAVVLQDLALVPYDECLDEDEPSEVHGAVLQTALTMFRKRHAVEDCRLCVGMSGSRVLVRTLALPPMDEKRLDGAITLEVQHQMPLPLNQLVWRHHILRRPAQASAAESGASWQVMVQAARQFHVDELLRVFRDVGLKVDAVQGDCAALHNFTLYELADLFPQAERSDSGPSKTPAVAVLDIGAHTTNLVLSGPDVFSCRSLVVGGESFTRELIRPLRLTRDQAEQLKRRPTAARPVSRVYALLEPRFRWLMEEVQRTLDAHLRQFPGVSIRQMLAVGGGAALHGLLRRLATGQ
jgi:type IV pilus assembly protein PilM